MADEDQKKRPSIPSWQRPQNPEQNPNSSENLPNNTSEKTDSDISKQITSSPLLEQAQRFLEDENIKDAPQERKIAFLEKKGVEANEIQKLLGIEEGKTFNAEDFKDELKTVHDSNNTIIPEQSQLHSESHTTPSQSIPSTTTAPTSSQREIPPIITYPEFLVKAQKPPPLVTIERLVNAAYTFAGISAIIYGASKYIVQPMLESLTEARHDFAEHTKEDLQKLNSKLESTVSHIPYIPTSNVLKESITRNRDEETDSINSDPTELFHRDVATQASPEIDFSDHHSSSNQNVELTPLNKSKHQRDTLESLQTNLSSLLQSMETSTPIEIKLKQTTTDFQTILDTIEGNQYYNNTTSTTSNQKINITVNSGNNDNNTSKYTWNNDQLYNNQQGGNSSGGNNNNNKKNDSTTSTGGMTEAAKFKAEIRALKGLFLSSRNFPTPKPVNTNSTGLR